MKKGLTLILLFCHINFSMFLPQVAERDSFDAAGQQHDDINSLFEFLDQVVLGNHDDSPEDEDDDSGQHFLLTKTVDVFNCYSFIELNFLSMSASSLKYPSFEIGKIDLSAFDIVSPPPEA